MCSFLNRNIWSESRYVRVGVATRHRSVTCSIRLLNIVDAKISEIFLSQKRRANRVRRYNQRKRKRLIMVVILSALLSCAPERSVWTLPRNDWWARNAGDTIDIGAWPDSMFVANLRMSKTSFKCCYVKLSYGELVTRLRSRLAINPRVHSTGGCWARWRVRFERFLV